MIPRCRHGNILLGCTEDTCEEQIAYIQINQARLEEYWAYVNDLSHLQKKDDA